MGKGLLSIFVVLQNIALNCHVKYDEHELVKIFIENTIPRLSPGAHLENLDITQFAHFLRRQERR